MGRYQGRGLVRRQRQMERLGCQTNHKKCKCLGEEEEKILSSFNVYIVF
jgi:hypothetical protein